MFSVCQVHIQHKQEIVSLKCKVYNVNPSEAFNIREAKIIKHLIEMCKQIPAIKKVDYPPYKDGKSSMAIIMILLCTIKSIGNNPLKKLKLFFDMCGT